ncbi:MAG: ethylbenzene dehydrogenase-related protein, partial [Thermoplasmata archaeon]
MDIRNSKPVWLVIVAIALSIVVAFPLAPTTADRGTRGLAGTIESAIASVAPSVDGDGTDAVWADATALTVTPGSTDIDIKSVYTATDIYFLATWSDATESDAKGQWSFNSTSSAWEQAGSDEDRLSFVWNITATGFNDNGCTVLCHPPDMRTDVDGELVDTWHWKATRTNPSGWLDDKYFNFTGRQADDATSGGYSSNTQTLNYTDDPASSTDVPFYWEPGATGADAKSILQSEIDGGEAWNISEVYTNGTMIDWNATVVDNTTSIPGYYQSVPVGSRGDVAAAGTWSAATWTLEW